MRMAPNTTLEEPPNARFDPPCLAKTAFASVKMRKSDGVQIFAAEYVLSREMGTLLSNLHIASAP